MVINPHHIQSSLSPSQDHRVMRKQLDILKKANSTSAERKFAEALKSLRIPFKAKAKIANREVDFLIGKYAIDIDGHAQDADKNVLLVRAGFVPVHYSNLEIKDPIKLKQIVKYYDYKFS